MDSTNEKKIFRQFVYNDLLSFSEILRKTKIESNLLAYFLKKLLKKNILQKSSEGKYLLSSKGEKLLPFYSEQESMTPLVVILTLIVQNGRVLLIKRSKRPYKGLFSILSGRMLLAESIEQGAKRICNEKLGVGCAYHGLRAVVHERFIDTETKHAFVFFLVCAKLPSNAVIQKINSFGDSLEWFSISKLPKNKIIASDYWLIKNKLNSKIDIVEETLEKNGRLMKIKK